MLGAVILVIGPWELVRLELAFAPTGADLPTRGELVWYGLLFVLAVVGLRSHGSLPRPHAGPLGETERLGWSLGALVLTLLAGTFATGWAPVTDDEAAYRMQGRLLLEGRVSEPVHALAETVDNPFIVQAWSDTSEALWTGCYPLIAGLLTAPGTLVGWPALGWCGFGALLVWHTSKLAETWFPEVDSRLVCALMMASPQLVLTGTFAHTVMPATLCTVVLARLALRVGDRARWCVAWGFVFGLLVHCRPVEALLTGLLALAAVFVHRRAVTPMGWAKRGAAAVAGGLPCLLAWLAHNYAVTGSFRKLPYGLVDGPKVYGFGATTFGDHHLLEGLHNVGNGWFRLVAAWGVGPYLLLAVAGPLLLGLRVDARLRWLAAAAGLHFAVYVPAPFPSVFTTGPTYQAWLIPILALAVSWGACSPEGSGYVRALWSAGLLAVWPWALFGASAVTDTIAQPLRLAEQAAEEGPIAVVIPQHRPDPYLAAYVFHCPVPTDDIWCVRSKHLEVLERALADEPARRLFHLRWSDGPPWRASLAQGPPPLGSGQ